MTVFERRVLDVEPGASVDHQAPFWQDAIVFVTAGEIDVECSSGECHRFACGSILTLARLPIRRVHNGCATQTRLLAIWRRAG